MAIEKIKILGVILELPAKHHCRSSPFTSKLGQIGSFGPLRKFIEYCRIVALLPVIPYYEFAQKPLRVLIAQPTIYQGYYSIFQRFWSAIKTETCSLMTLRYA